MTDARLAWRRYVLLERGDIPLNVRMFAITISEFSANGVGCRPAMHQLAKAGFGRANAYKLRKEAIRYGILRHQYKTNDGRPVTAIAYPSSENS